MYLYVSKNFSIYFMAPFDFINGQSTIGRVSWSYFYTLNIKIHIKDNTGNYIIFTIIIDVLPRFVV